MQVYSVFALPGEKGNFLLVKQKFSFLAAIFNFFWCLYHRYWFLAILTLIARLAVMLSHNYILQQIFDFGLIIIFGLFASDLQEYYAKHKGYKLVDIIAASGDKEAELKYLARS